MNSSICSRLTPLRLECILLPINLDYGPEIAMALRAILNKPGLFCIVLEEYDEGVYVFAYDTPENYPDHPFRDQLQDDWGMAKRHALHRFGVQESDLNPVPDTHVQE